MACWLIVGVSGVTCGGKTTLSQSLYDYLSDRTISTTLAKNVIIGQVRLVNQDDYFLPEDHHNHEWIDSIRHINFDILNALDMAKMCSDLYGILGKQFHFYAKRDEPQVVNILLIDGFLIFNHSVTNRICQLKFHLHLPYEKCYERRVTRVYDPPDVMGYFELCVWPMYEQHFAELREKDDIVLLNGESPKEKCFAYVLNQIIQAL